MSQKEITNKALRIDWFAFIKTPKIVITIHTFYTVANTPDIPLILLKLDCNWSVALLFSYLSSFCFLAYTSSNNVKPFRKLFFKPIVVF